MRRYPYPKAKTYTTSDGVELNYELQKKKTGKPLVVLLHGMGGDLSAWDAERIILSEQGYSILTMDLRGHGLSGRPRRESAYSLIHFAHDVRSLLNHEGYEKAVIVGHCFGGVVGMTFAHLYPEMVQALVLIDSTYKAPVLSRFPIDPSVVVRFLGAASHLAPTWHLHSYKDLVKAGHLENWNLLGTFGNLLHTSLYTWMITCKDILALDMASTLRTLRVKTLVITGEDDTVFPPHIAKEIHHLIHNSSFASIPLANHILVVNNPAEVSVPLLKFLTTVSQRKEGVRGSFA